LCEFKNYSATIAKDSADIKIIQRQLSWN